MAKSFITINKELSIQKSFASLLLFWQPLYFISEIIDSLIFFFSIFLGWVILFLLIFLILLIFLLEHCVNDVEQFSIVSMTFELKMILLFDNILLSKLILFFYYIYLDNFSFCKYLIFPNLYFLIFYYIKNPYI